MIRLFCEFWSMVLFLSAFVYWLPVIAGAIHG